MAREHTQVWRCRFLSHLVGMTDVRFGSKADIRVAKSHVRFTPKRAFHSRSRMPAKGHKRTLCSAIVMYAFFTLMAAKFGSQSGPVWRAHTLPHFPMTGIFKKVPIMHRYDLPLALAATWLSEL